MLVLNRKSGEEVVVEINGQKLTILIENKGGRTKLLFNAPNAFKITRAELTKNSKK